jgi:2-phospho-L-lactate guanylyltransferase (CobY/MobA/RfbA family)
VDAIILAGALNTGALQNESPVRYEAEIEIAGRPMLDYILTALKEVSEIERIIVCGPETAVSEDVKPLIYKRVEPGITMIDSLIHGLNEVAAVGSVLVTTSDIPLLSADAVRDFLSNCRKRTGDVYYSFINKEICEIKYPGVTRTYVKLREGIFTGGNIALISEKVIRENAAMLKRAVAMRKKPLQLCGMLGWKFFINLLFGNLSISQIERRVTQIFNFTAVGVVSDFPEIGIDVDKPSDLKLARDILAHS